LLHGRGTVTRAIGDARVLISASTAEEDADRTIEAILSAWREVRASTAVLHGNSVPE
jgi:hypothetical protein